MLVEHLTYQRQRFTEDGYKRSLLDQNQESQVREGLGL